MSNDLRNLWRLHLVDLGLHEIRQRAAALDPGRKIQGELAALNTELEAKNEHLKTLRGEQTDIELRQKSIDEKLKKIDKELYGGKVVNPREVEALQKEIATLKKQRGDLDTKLLELWDAIPPVQAEVDVLAKKVAEKKAELDEYQKKVLKLKAQLEAEFKERSAQRPALAKEVPTSMLARYDSVRQKHAGIGMAGVTKNGNCDACGTKLPVKNIEAAKEGRIVTCEACHRILYASEGLI